MSQEKKTILFVNESLACAGGEKSLLNLLAALDYDKYEVSLQLMTYGLPWEKYIDSRVKVLPPISYCEFTRQPLKSSIEFALRNGKLRWLISRLAFSWKLRIRKGLNNVKRSVLYWETQNQCFESVRTEYDYVIAYAQGIPTFYVADKTKARIKKLAWINVTYTPDGFEKNYINHKYRSIDTINAVSEEIKEIESAHWPDISEKLSVFRDPINPALIYSLSEEHIDIDKHPRCLTLVTLGRLTQQKGYDIAIEAAAELKHRGIPFRWYILGIGPLENELKKAVQAKGLQTDMLFLGVKENPYPYLKLADIYVQTSRHEGFGLAIAEARMLNIPVVATDFNTVHIQMIHEKNGLIADLDGNSVADAIERLLTDRGLYDSVVEYLKQEPKGNLEIIPQFYKLLEG